VIGWKEEKVEKKKEFPEIWSENGPFAGSPGWPAYPV